VINHRIVSIFLQFYTLCRLNIYVLGERKTSKINVCRVVFVKSSFKISVKIYCRENNELFFSSLFIESSNCFLLFNFIFFKFSNPLKVFYLSVLLLTKNKIQIMTSKIPLNLQKNGFTRSQKIPARISFPEVNGKKWFIYRKFFCNPKEQKPM
jgi:hypothetical protein